MARLRQAEGDYAHALTLLQEAERVYVSDFFPDMRPLGALRARLWIVMGQLREAQGWARDAGLSSQDEPSYLREFEHITLARLLLAIANADNDAQSRAQALGLLGRLRQAAETGKRTRSLIEILILEAIATADSGDSASALAALEQALRAAEPEGYVRLFLDEGQAMTVVLREASRRGITPGYISELLAGGEPPTARPDKTQRLLEPLSDRELEVLRLLASELSAHERISGSLEDGGGSCSSSPDGTRRVRCSPRPVPGR